VPRCIAGRPSSQDHLAAPFPERPTVGLRRRFQLRGLMDAFTETLLAKVDQLAALADQLPAGELRQQLVDQIAALNVAITQHVEG